MRLGLVITLLLLYSGIASAATIDFEGALETSDPVGGSSGLPTFVRSQGYEFYTNAGFQIGAGVPASTGLYYCPGCTAEMHTVSGGTFDLKSLDIAIPLPDSGDNFISLTGYYVEGDSVNINLSLVGTDWTNFQFGEEWQNLHTLVFGASVGGGLNSVGLDNIVVTSVPVPAAVWLFGSGLGLLGWMRRRQTA
jgi:hypothetical protein